MPSKKNISVSIMPDEIINTGISNSKNGYNHAYLTAKRGENEVMNISYEWKGEAVPDFIMDMMGFMQANKEEIAAAVESYKKEEAAKKKDKKGGGKC